MSRDPHRGRTQASTRRLVWSALAHRALRQARRVVDLATDLLDRGPEFLAATDTVPTLSEACAAAAAAAVERPEVCAAAAAMAWAVACNWAAEDDTRVDDAADRLLETPGHLPHRRPALLLGRGTGKALSSSICRERIRLSMKTWTDRHRAHLVPPAETGNRAGRVAGAPGAASPP